MHLKIRIKNMYTCTYICTQTTAHIYTYLRNTHVCTNYDPGTQEVVTELLDEEKHNYDPGTQEVVTELLDEEKDNYGPGTQEVVTEFAHLSTCLRNTHVCTNYGPGTHEVVTAFLVTNWWIHTLAE
jgi:hypothetical protein